jgi:hypothetical protein
MYWVIVRSLISQDFLYGSYLTYEEVQENLPGIKEDNPKAEIVIVKNYCGHDTEMAK